MAKTCDRTYCALCAAAILERSEAVRAQLAGVFSKNAGKDIECVHHMRVASRRLRAALKLFRPCLSRQADAWNRQVRRITRALGRARDLDVQIAFVRAYQRRHPQHDWRPGLDRLLLRLRRWRGGVQQKVHEALAAVEEAGTLEDMRRRMRAQWPRRGRHDGITVQAYRLAGRTIQKLLHDLLDYDGFVTKPDCIEEHHRMRIAAKRLRYSLEVFEPIYGKPMAEPIRAARRLQTLLGELHDCDVWIAFLPDFLASEKARAIEYSGRSQSVRRLTAGIGALCENREDHRRQLYRRCVKFWKKTKSERIWQDLDDLLRRAPAEHEEAPEAPKPRSADEVHQAKIQTLTAQAAGPPTAAPFHVVAAEA